MPSYVPILKWKMGERKALKHTALSDRQNMLPLIELLPDSSDDEVEFGEAAASRFSKEVADSWGPAPVFVDFSQLGLDGAAIGGLLQAGRTAGLALVPVVWLETPRKDLAAVAQEVRHDGRGACLRLDAEGALKVVRDGGLTRLAEALELSPSGIDVLLDLGSIDESEAAKAQLVASAILPTILQHGWRSVTFAASSFPPDLSGVGVGMSTIERAEWSAYKALLQVNSLGFGDYAVAYPEYAPAPYLGSAAVRYTIAEEWLIVRGRPLNRPGGFTQFHSLCAQLVADARYCGPNFSWGDGRIEECAQNVGGTGNLTTWRQVATNHHLAFVSRQVANLSGASSAHAPARVGP